MYRMTILYETPDDPEQFRTYYRQNHLPLARRMRGLTGWNLQWVEDPEDYILVAELYATDRRAMDAVLASDAGVAARADLENFVTAGVTFLMGPEHDVVVT